MPRASPDWALTGAVRRLTGRVAAELGRYETAAGHLEQALQFDPHDREALDRLALVRFRQQRYEAALELYETAAPEMNPEVAEVHANRGVALYRLGRVDAALRKASSAPWPWTRRWRPPAAPSSRSAPPTEALPTAPTESTTRPSRLRGTAPPAPSA